MTEQNIKAGKREEGGPEGGEGAKTKARLRGKVHSPLCTFKLLEITGVLSSNGQGQI